MEDVFAIQDDISRSIVAELQGHLQGEGAERLVNPPTTNTEAYQLYQKGRYYSNQQGPGKAVHYFELALLDDPHYALAYSGLADSYNLLGFYAYLPPGESFSRARTAAQKALDIDDTLAEAHCSLGFVKLVFDWEWHAAEVCFRRAIELNQQYYWARY